MNGWALLRKRDVALLEKILGFKISKFRSKFGAQG